MPTGYTAKLCEQGQTFPEFAMTCARAMGVCVMMRDEPLDTPIPERFEPEDYYENQKTEAESRLTALRKMTEAEQLAEGERLKTQSVETFVQLQAKTDETNQRIDAMLVTVRAWVPPSGEHVGLREFMSQQLETSRERDWQGDIAAARAKPPADYFSEALARAERDVSYFSAKHAEELQRTENRNRWLAQLRESLKPESPNA